MNASRLQQLADAITLERGGRPFRAAGNWQGTDGRGNRGASQEDHVSRTNAARHPVRDWSTSGGQVRRSGGVRPNHIESEIMIARLKKHAWWVALFVLASVAAALVIKY